MLGAIVLKITELAQHLHEIRKRQTGRALGNAMRVSEVWNAITESDKTTISEIRIYLEDLPRPVDGCFLRGVNPTTGEEVAHVLVHRQLPRHWREFVAIKEMMHCYTPMADYVITPKDAGNLVRGLTSSYARYTPAVAADDIGILAATEVILPHKTIEMLRATGQDEAQIATRHGLHPDVAQQICRTDLIMLRQNGNL